MRESVCCGRAPIQRAVAWEGLSVLDKLSCRILDYMLTNADTPSGTYHDFDEDLAKIANVLGSDSETIRAAVRYLEQGGYLKYGYSGHTPIWFYLDHKGLHWRYFRRREILDYIADKWPDFIAVVISLLSLVISVLALRQ